MWLQARERILGVLCKHMKLAGDLDLKTLARRCNGFVGADLAALCKEAAVVAVNRIFGNLFGVRTKAVAAEAAAAARRAADAAEIPKVVETAAEAQAAPLAEAIPPEASAAEAATVAAAADGVTGAEGSASEAVAAAAEGGDLASAARASLQLRSGPLSPEQLSELAISMVCPPQHLASHHTLVITARGATQLRVNDCHRPLSLTHDVLLSRAVTDGL